MCHHWTFCHGDQAVHWSSATGKSIVHNLIWSWLNRERREHRLYCKTIFTKSVIMLFVLSCPTCDFCLSSPLYPSIGLHPINNVPKVGLLWLSSRRRCFQLDESSHLSSVSSATSHYSSVFPLFQATWLAHCGCASLLVQWDNETATTDCVFVCVRLPQRQPQRQPT